MASAAQFCTYDDSEHLAPPARIRWIRRAGGESNERWIFLRCCGQLGKPDSHGTVRSVRGCNPSPESMSFHHPGQLSLLRISRSSVVNSGGGPTARWTCCKKVAIPQWCGAWDVRDLQIPMDLVANGCEPGPLRLDEVDLETQASRSSGPDFAEFARSVQSVGNRQRTRNTSSSGNQSQVLRELSVLISEVKPTQKTIHILFSDHRDIFQLMDRLLAGVCQVKDVNPIRISRRSPTEPFHCIDNRRWFCFSVVAPRMGLEAVPAKEIRWMAEFDDKLRQRPNLNDTMHVLTDAEGQQWAAQWLDQLSTPAGFSHCRAMIGVEPEQRVFVSNIAPSVTRQELQDHLESVGEVSLLAPFNSGKGKVRCKSSFAIVEYATAAAAGRALADLDGQVLADRALSVRSDEKGFSVRGKRARLGRDYPMKQLSIPRSKRICL